MRRKKIISLTLAELAGKLSGRVEGGPDAAAISVSGLGTLDEAGVADLAFITSDKFTKKAAGSNAGAFLVSETTLVPGRPCVVVAHVMKSLLQLFDLWHPDERPPAGIHPSAVVDPAARIAPTASVGPLTVVEAGAEIGENVEIGAQCFIGREAVIGVDCLLHPGVKVLERVRLGRRVILHSGVVLGADGYGYEVMDMRAVKIPQVGTVVIEDDVEIGANTCVDRAFLSETRIGAGTKLDNLVQIAHNVRVGRSCGMAAQVGVAGSTTIGDGCMFWGQAGIKDNMKIGSRVELMGQTAPVGDVPDGSRMVGSPALPLLEQARIIAAQKQLPDLLKRVKKLEKALEK